MEQRQNKRFDLLNGYDSEKKNRNSIYQMWQEIFEDPEQFAQYYFKEIYPENRVFMMWNPEMERNNKGIKGCLCGMIHLNPYLFQIDAVLMSLDYIVGVAVDKTMRRCGIMRQMLQQVMEMMREEGKPFTYLMPADEAYYTPFDFQFVYERYLWEPDDKRLNNKILKENQNKFAFIPYSQQKYISSLKPFQEEFFKKFQIAPVRTERYWERLKAERQAENGDVLLIFSQGICRGYLTYGMENKETCVIQEVVTEEAVQAVLGDFWAEKTFIKRKAWLDWFHKDLDKLEVKQVPMIMFRILHLQNMMKLARAAEAMEVIIQIEDPFLEENSGIYRWKLGQQRSEVNKTKQEPEIFMSIAELTQLLFGGKKRAKSCEKLEKLSKIIPLEQIYISEIV